MHEAKTLYHIHPREAGFTLSSACRWYGRIRAAIWEHCDKPAKSTSKPAKGKDGMYRDVTIIRCEVCGLKIVNSSKGGR